MKIRILPSTLVALAAASFTMSCVRPANADGETNFTARGEVQTAQARFISIDPMSGVGTYVAVGVEAVNGRTTLEKSIERTNLVLVVIEFDAQTGAILTQRAGADSSPGFLFHRDLQTASVSGNVALENETTGNLDRFAINLKWTATEKSVNSPNNSRFDFGPYRYVQQIASRSRFAQPAGTILVNDPVTNYAETPFWFGELEDLHKGFVQIKLP